MHHIGHIILLFLLPLFQFLPFTYAYGYRIDASCTDPDGTLVEDALQRAFAMASLVRQNIQQPRDADVNRLLGLLFAGPNYNPATMAVNELSAVLAGIESMATAEATMPGEDERVRNSVVVYCSMDRIEKNDRGVMVDTVTHNQLGQDCDSSTLGFTFIPRRVKIGNSGTFHPSQITICPWFFQWAHKQEYGTWADIEKGRKTAFMKTASSKLFGWANQDTPIDALRLLDLTLLHELAHTFAAGDQDDVEIPSSALYGTKKDGYGWKACKKLAKNGGIRRNGTPAKPYNNADSIALLGSAIRLLRGNPQQFVSDDGKILQTRPA